MKKEFVVIGLGRFGSQVARTLSGMGRSVLAVDISEKRVQRMASFVTHVVQADAADEENARSLGLASFDTAVVAIGNDLEASILVTLLLKEMGVGEVIAKASSENHGKLLARIGADRVVFPERDMADRLARSLVSESLLDYLELTPDVSIAELTVGEKLDGKTLRDLGLIARFSVTVLAVRSQTREVRVSPPAGEMLNSGDIMVVIGTNVDIGRLQDWMSS